MIQKRGSTVDHWNAWVAKRKGGPASAGGSHSETNSAGGDIKQNSQEDMSRHMNHSAECKSSSSIRSMSKDIEMPREARLDQSNKKGTSNSNATDWSPVLPFDPCQAFSPEVPEPEVECFFSLRPAETDSAGESDSDSFGSCVGELLGLAETDSAGGSDSDSFGSYIGHTFDSAECGGSSWIVSSMSADCEIMREAHLDQSNKQGTSSSKLNDWAPVLPFMPGDEDQLS